MPPDPQRKIAELTAIAEDCRRRAADLQSTGSHVSSLVSATSRAISGSATGDDVKMLQLLREVSLKAGSAAREFATAEKHAQAGIRRLQLEQRNSARKRAPR